MKRKTRNFLGFIISGIFILLGYTTRAKKRALKGDFILSIYFHSPSKSLFEFCTKWLIKNNFKILSQSDILSLSSGTIHFPKGGVIISVDDGWDTNEDNIAAIADKYNIPVTFFVSTEPVEKGNFWWSFINIARERRIPNYSFFSNNLKSIPNGERTKIIGELKKNIELPREAMTIEQIQRIASSRNVTIGSHTVTHPILPNCGDSESYFELEESKRIIEEWVKKEIYCFSYPNGDNSDREFQYLKKTGYKLAYTTKPNYFTNDSLQNPLALPRFCVHENISKAEAICRMTGIWQRYISNK